MSPEATFAHLNQYEFHDLDVTGIELLFQDGLQVRVTTQPYNDEIQVYTGLQLVFSGVTVLNMGTVLLEQNTSLEMYDFTYQYDTCYRCTLIFLTGFGKSTIRMIMEYADIQAITSGNGFL